MKFEELLAKYGITAEEVTFEIEGLSDEELEAKFAEAFDDDTDEETNTDENTNTDDTDVDDNQDDTDDGEDAGDSGEEKFTKIFTLELSHDDIRCALYSLISQYEEEDNEWYGIREVYDNYFIMQGWYNNKLYKISYSVDGENVSLEGERQEVFELIVSESEKLAIEKMREDYAALEAQYNELKDFKANIEAAELQAQKDTVFAKAEYECLADSEAFKTLKADAEKYSVEEIESRVKAIFADHIIATGTFSFVKKEEPNAMKFAIETTDNTNSKPYGTLFDD